MPSSVAAGFFATLSLGETRDMMLRIIKRGKKMRKHPAICQTVAEVYAVPCVPKQ